MSPDLVDTVWDAVVGRVGDDLRVVTRYEAGDFETRMREDVRAAYTTSEDRVVVDETIIDQLSRPRTERAFRAGVLRAVVRVFDDAWILSWPSPTDPKAGVIVSIQRDGAATMGDVEWCLDYLDEEIAPRLE